MKCVYPIVLTPSEEGGYVVYVPDLDINTQGENLPEAIAMARDAICMWGICEQDAGHKIPAPLTLSPKCAKDEIVSLVDVDFDAYRRANETRAVRKNVTIPSWLNELAEKNGINFSSALQEGLRNQLHLK